MVNRCFHFIHQKQSKQPVVAHNTFPPFHLKLWQSIVFSCHSIVVVLLLLCQFTFSENPQTSKSALKHEMKNQTFGTCLDIHCVLSLLHDV